MFVKLLAFIIMVPLPFILVWVFVVAHLLTEKLEGLLLGCYWVNQNKSIYSDAGLAGKFMRSGIIFMCCLTPDLCERKGLVVKSELAAIPRALKRQLYAPFAALFLWTSVLMVAGLPAAVKRIGVWYGSVLSFFVG